MSAPAVAVPLPFIAKCSVACGVGLWVQSEPWPVDTVLMCECGARAYVDDCDAEGCGRPGTVYWRDEIAQPLRAGETYERYEPGDILHRACAEHAPPSRMGA